ncbi:LysR family transcriptional regulator [Nocardioides immobilis]|uniref:LysR family transcriptional regulator n=1 Tax=Nocardioides immobilis TaxID=2049295 RepID=A0A417XUC0_9ACTN|nr:LysR family transcriptional regulator [Nocardioides immobilis]RHW24069.1 LysR family transcriptional regulator [Nocardioides immobilis]
MTKLRQMDANLVVMLDAILAEKNLTRAGERIGMTQPAMSGVLRRLRKQLDDPLLVKVGRHFELTPRARSLVPVVAEAMTVLTQTLDPRPPFVAESSDRTFLIAASDYALSVLAAPLIRHCNEVAPSVSLEFDLLPADDNVDPSDLLRRDLFIASSGRGVPGRKQEVFSDEFVVIADRDNPRLGDDNTLELSDLRELNYLAAVFGDVHSTPADDMLAQHGVTPYFATTVRGFLSVPLLLAGTLMFSIVPRRVAEAHPDRIAVVRTPLTPATLVEVAHWHPANSADAGLLWLLAALRNIGVGIDEQA